MIRLETAGFVPVPMAPPSGSSATALAFELVNMLAETCINQIEYKNIMNTNEQHDVCYPF